jgi:RNA polymerase sigma factor for flagellar operon FliA
MNQSQRDQLILSHLPQVELLAKRLQRRCPQVELDDLIQAGTIGLISAVDRFDPERGCLLKTIAEHKIRGALLDYLRQVDPLPRNVRRFQKQRDAILAELEGSGSDLPHEWVAQRLGVSVVRYVALCRIVAAAEPISIQESPRALKLAG